MIDETCTWCDFALAGVVSWKIGLPGVRLEVWNDRVGKDTVPFPPVWACSTPMTKKKKGHLSTGFFRIAALLMSTVIC